MSAAVSPAVMLMELAADCEHDPLAFVRGFWPQTEPRIWQAEIFGVITEHLSDPATRHQVLKIAVSSGHGIGKSAFMGMLTTWALSCHVLAKVMITAGTGQQLATKTAPEITKWVKSSLAASWLDCHATSIRSTQTDKPEQWRADFQTWSTHNTEAFAGLHNVGRIIILIYDEASAIEAPVWEVSEGALTDEGTIIIWVAFGNPTQNVGRFKECFGRFKHRWKTFQIDSRTVEGTNKEQIAKWIADYGEDSDFVRVRVRGEFPRAGSSQFIGSDVVAAARLYKAEGFSGLPKILSVDVARFGDDQTVIGTRQGRKFTILAKLRGLPVDQVTERTIEFIKSQAPDATIVDAIGVGGGVYDMLKFRGYSHRLFAYNPTQTPRDPAAYRNARAEMWGRMRDWLVAGAEIPDDPELAADLTGPEYFFSAKDQIQIEQKEDMKARGLSSPDSADCLAQTFQVDVSAPKPKEMPRMYTPGEREHSWMLS